MKKLIHIVLFAPLLGQAQTAQVHIAGSDYPVIFADTNLSFAIRQRIASDMKTSFSPASSFEKLKKGDSVDVTVSLPGGGTSTNSHGKWDGVCMANGFNSNMLPSGKLGKHVFIVDYNNEESIRVSTNASGVYLEAFALVEAHSNAVKKVSDFIGLVSAPDLLTKPPQERRDMFHAVPWFPEDDEFSDENILEFLSEMITPYKCPGVSVLHFSVEQRPEIGNAEVLVMWLPLVEKAQPPKYGNTMFFALPVLFHNGKWGFGRIPDEYTRGV